MKKIYYTTLLFLGYFYCHAQVVWTEPPFPSQFDSITLFFDATQGNAALANFTGDVYAHAGVITNQSVNGNDWKHTVGNWGIADDRTLMTRVSENIYSLSYRIDDFYQIPQGEEVLKLAFVFRNVDGSIVGRDSDGSDIFFTIYPPNQGLLFSLLSPERPGTVVLENDSLFINVRINDTALFSIRDNGEVIYSDTATEVSFYHHPTALGLHELIFEASTDTTIILTTNYFVLSATQQRQDPPAGVVNGINYFTDSTYLFQLYAPLKKFVFLLCPPNNYLVANEFQMNLAHDSSTWWIEVPRSEFQNNQYTYQYLVDGNLKIADPFSTVVLDPVHDPFVDPKVLASLSSYPAGLTQGIVTAFDPAPPEFDFTVQHFQKADKSKLVIYELLIRDFLADHSFSSLTDTLSYFKKLGVNAIELMPVQEFEGNNSWGYNPSFHMAVDKYYGTRTQLKRFIDAAHQEGIAVILDVVFNHAFSQSPLAQLYWDASNFRPSPESPYLNVTARHPFNVGYDFNHESPVTKAWVKQVLSYWIKEFKVDGFRFDLSKGLTQYNSGNDAGLMSRYDASRIAIIEDYADHIWSLDSASYVILEHFADNDEEIELSNYGAMLWGNMNHQFSEAAKGFRSDLEGIDYTFRGWSHPNLVGYMESHDEERITYRVLREGDREGDYNTRNLKTALQRMAAASTIFYLVPGPKMLWEFGELGYEFPINRCVNGTINNDCRLDPKPIRWDYLDDPDRERLRQVNAALIHLKRNYPTFSTTDFRFNDGNLFVKSIYLNHPEMDAVVLANYRVTSSDIIPSFSYPGTWYEYFTGDSLVVDNTEERITFSPGEYRVYTSKEIETPDDYTTGNSNFAFRQVGIYPNIIVENQDLNVSLEKAVQIRQIMIRDISGKLISIDYQKEGDLIHISFPDQLVPGLYLLSINTDGGIYSGKFIRQ